MKKQALSYKPITVLGNGKGLFHRAGNRLRNHQVMFHYDVALAHRGEYGTSGQESKTVFVGVDYHRSRWHVESLFGRHRPNPIQVVYMRRVISSHRIESPISKYSGYDHVGCIPYCLPSSVFLSCSPSEVSDEAPLDAGLRHCW